MLDDSSDDEDWTVLLNLGEHERLSLGDGGALEDLATGRCDRVVTEPSMA